MSDQRFGPDGTFLEDDYSDDMCDRAPSITPTVPDDPDRCLTPKWIVDGLRKFAPGSMIDPFSEPDNSLGAQFWRTKDDEWDMLQMLGGKSIKIGNLTRGAEWFIFMNPPYSRHKKKLALQYLEDAAFNIVGHIKWAVLIPADMSTDLCAKFEQHATHMGFFDSRIQFDVSRGMANAKQTTARFSNVLYSNFGYDIEGIRCYQMTRFQSHG